MKCSEAIKKLDDDFIFVSPNKDQDLHDAIILAIGCLKWRLSQTHLWASSRYALLEGETREDPLAHNR